MTDRRKEFVFVLDSDKIRAFRKHSDRNALKYIEKVYEEFENNQKRLRERSK